MHQSRPGFTLTEMIIVVAMLGLVMLVSLPRFGGLHEASRVRSARQEVEAAIATARAAAIQKGYPARLHLAGHSIQVVVDTTAAGDSVTVIPLKPLDGTYGVRLNVTHSVITFDSRGFASAGGPVTVRLLGDTRSDSVCLTALGQIMPRGCSL